MPANLLYSTNAFLKYYINEKFRRNTHYVWCSDCFDAKSLSKYSLGASTAPSSNPAEIYRQLKYDVQNQDRHSHKINEQKASLKQLAIDWEISGEVTNDDKEEIIFMLDTASFDYWRPLLYIIPTHLIKPRIKDVPIARRASLGAEYIIEDLKNNEFDIIEL